MQKEQAKEQLRLRVLREERERQQQAVHKERQRLQAVQLRLQEEQKREQQILQKEREKEEKAREQQMSRDEEKLQEEMSLQQRLERERRQRLTEEHQEQQSKQQQHLARPRLQHQGQQQVLVARAMAPKKPNTVHKSHWHELPSSLNLQYDGIDDKELNWRLDSYASLSDYTIIVNRARPGPYAPDFDLSDLSSIEFISANSVAGLPKADTYYVHKAMIAVGSRRSELLGRRIREAAITSGRSTPDGHFSEANVHETVMLEGAADAMGAVLDFCYYPDRALDIHVENALPLMYLGQRYKIHSLLKQAEAYVMEKLESSTAMYFLLDSYMYKLDYVCSRAIDLTAANLGKTEDLVPIYRMPPELFRRIVLSKELKCDSELLSLIVYLYCAEREFTFMHEMST